MAGLSKREIQKGQRTRKKNKCGRYDKKRAPTGKTALEEKIRETAENVRRMWKMLINVDRFSWASWNFFAAGHGKGIPEVIGGTLKRTADRKVMEGCDILSSSTCIKLYVVEESDNMATEDPLLTKTLKTLQGTMKVHQILAVSPENVLHRDVSCTCLHETCPEHSLHEFSLAPWGSDHKSRGHKRKQTK